MKKKLEHALQRVLPLKHFIFTGYARNGLYLLIKAMGWDSDAEIVIPAFTCPIIKFTVSESGVVPVLVDAERDGLNMDPDGFARAITDRTKAVYVVHTYGSAAKIEKICAIARRHGILVIEDLAHTLFYQRNGRQLGTFGDVAVLSFTKKIINFEGAAIGTNHTHIYERMTTLQRALQKDRRLSLVDVRDYYVRLVGSWWEARFSPIALILMKIDDLVNDLLYKGGYGLSLDPSKFTLSEYAMRLTCWQLEKLSGRNNGHGYLKFRERFGGVIDFSALDQNNGDTLPAYYSGIPKRSSRMMRLLSFRTWRNFTTNGHYPRAAYLYSSYRLFARSILLMPQAVNGNGRPDRQTVTAEHEYTFQGAPALRLEPIHQRPVKPGPAFPILREGRTHSAVRCFMPAQAGEADLCHSLSEE